MIERLIRQEVKELIPYSVSSISRGVIKLDGNENPYPLPEIIQKEIIKKFKDLNFHRYPEDDYLILKEKIAGYLGYDVKAEEILPGNGSDEILNFLIQTFIEQGDAVLALSPTFSMYRIFTRLAGGLYGGVQLEEDGTLDVERFWHAVKIIRPKMIILCSPNNPTGTLLSLNFIEEVAKNFTGILVIDEAYAEFSKESVISLLRNHPNMVIIRTFSKAFGLAGIRLGYMVAATELLQQVKKVVPPYNVNILSQLIGSVVLDNYFLMEKRIAEIISEREKLFEVFSSYHGWRVLPSKANFLFVRGRDVSGLAREFEINGIKVRRFSAPLTDALRITVGTPWENEKVIEVIQTFKERRKNDG